MDQEQDNAAPAEHQGVPVFPTAGAKAESRRLRHSFRFCVMTVVAFTGMLWVSEKYMRYDLAESQYIAALTLEPESARAVLRQVVKRDAEKHDPPTPQYLAALAAREESDLVLPVYERAYKASPNSAGVATLYGCRLFQAERYADARERFREAGLQPGKNVLPRYLEAAALAHLTPGDSDLSESLTLMAKTNSTDWEVSLPQPVWSGALPSRGYWYEKLRRQIADECCAPLYRFSDLLIAKAKKQIALRQPQYWDSWLETLQTMGERLAFTGEPSTVKATAGIQIQLAALEQREAIRTLEDSPSTDLAQRRTKLNSAMEAVNTFETQRDARIARDMAAQTMPLFLGLKTMGLGLFWFVLAYAASKLCRVDRRWGALAHSRSMMRVSAGGFVVMLALLAIISGIDLSAQSAAAITVADHLPPVPVLAGALGMTWWVTSLALLGFGLLYAYWRMTAYDRGFAQASPEATAARPPQFRQAVYLSFLRRYYGIMAGLLACLFCTWALLFRVFTSLYPWQIKLLTTGLADEEAKVIKLLLGMLQTGIQ